MTREPESSSFHQAVAGPESLGGSVQKESCFKNSKMQKGTMDENVHGEQSAPANSYCLKNCVQRDFRGCSGVHDSQHGVGVFSSHDTRPEIFFIVAEQFPKDNFAAEFIIFPFFIPNTYEEIHFHLGS